MTAIRSLLPIGLLLFAWGPVRGASEFDGAWRGTYNGQPSALLPDGTYPETVNKFELRLHDSNGAVTGEFRGGSEHKAWVPLTNGKKFGDRACFDVVLGSDDMRWCIEVTGEQLSGTWSRGPEGGPIQGGAGAGARLFKVKGSKEP